MKNSDGLFHLIKIGLGIALLAAVSGCVGYVEPGYGGPVVVPVSGVYFYDGIYEGGPYWHDYGRRGYESRGRAHGGERGGRR